MVEEFNESILFIFSFCFLYFSFHFLVCLRGCHALVWIIPATVRRLTLANKILKRLEDFKAYLHLLLERDWYIGGHLSCTHTNFCWSMRSCLELLPAVQV